MKPQEIAQRLFFIVGCGRSGTTLLKSMLDAHPGITLPPETFFFSTICRRFSGSNNAPLNDKVDYVASRWWIRDAGVSAQDIHAQLQSFDNPGWHEIFLATMAVMTSDKPQEFLAVGERTPAHIADATELLEKFPDCRAIHIVRDPRAVLASYRGVKIGTNQAVAVIREWQGAWKAHQQLADYPRYLLIRYEDLIADSESVLRKVCATLNVPFDDNMLAFHTRADKGFAEEQAHHQSTLKPLFTSSLDKWKEQLPPWQLSLVEAHLQEGMAGHGYELFAAERKPKAWDYMLSDSLDRLHRHAVRRPRQLLKRRRALKRLDSAKPSST